jgi:hypothetical protein
MKLNEGELVALIASIHYLLDRTYIELDVSNDYTEDFKQKVLPIITRIFTKHKYFNHEDISSVYMKVCEEYLKIITSDQGLKRERE